MNRVTYNLSNLAYLIAAILYKAQFLAIEYD